MIAAIVQARIRSTRLFGKVLAEIVGKPLMWHALNRLRAAQELDEIIVATTGNDTDAPLRKFLREEEVKTFIGSEDDVLDRYYRAARFYRVDVIVRVTPDDPFKDPEVIDRAVRIFKEAVPAADFVANCSYDGSIKATYPEGLDIEVFSFACLENIWANARRASEREHVTPYVFNNPKDFRIVGFEYDRDLSHMRWTIDYERDLAFAREIYKRLYPKKEIFFMRDILELLYAEPELAKINSGVPYHEGYMRSVQAEEDT